MGEFWCYNTGEKRLYMVEAEKEFDPASRAMFGLIKLCGEIYETYEDILREEQKHLL